MARSNTNWVYMRTDVNNLTWTNVTLPGHRFYPGTVVNFVYTDGSGTSYARSVGTGVTLHAREDVAMGSLWFNMAQRNAVRAYQNRWANRRVVGTPAGSCNP
jgi:hypothetical protein